MLLKYQKVTLSKAKTAKVFKILSTGKVYKLLN
jgi:hypothetical protein